MKAESFVGRHVSSLYKYYGVPLRIEGPVAEPLGPPGSKIYIFTHEPEDPKFRGYLIVFLVDKAQVLKVHQVECK
jgi:hypothetical protein